MAMEADKDDVWGAVATSPSVSPPATSLSLHLLAASGVPFLQGVGSPFHPGGVCYRNVAPSPSSPFFSGAASPFPRLAPLDAGPARRALEREMCLGPSPSPTAGGSSAASPFPRLAQLDAGPARRALEREMCLGGPSPPAGGSSAAPVERRKKRMIKNRESASRSRARKHAHVAQIETEVAELREANEQLRQKYDQLKASVEVTVPVKKRPQLKGSVEVPVPVKKTLQRVLSAPF